VITVFVNIFLFLQLLLPRICSEKYGNSMPCFMVHKILFHFLFSQSSFESFIVSFVLPIRCPGSENWSMQNIELDFRSLILCSVLFYFIIIIFYSSRIRICYGGWLEWYFWKLAENYHFAIYYWILIFSGFIY
jgi:hypothetical protein